MKPSKIIDNNKTLMCKTDESGIVEYASDYFIELSEYSEGKIIGKKLESILHPNMPRLILDFLWNSITQRRKITGIIKFESKSGMPYWLEIKYDYLVDMHTRKIANIFLYANAADNNATLQIQKLYDKLVKIERNVGIDAAKKYFTNFLEDNNVTYIDFISRYLKV